MNEMTPGEGSRRKNLGRKDAHTKVDTNKYYEHKIYQTYQHENLKLSPQYCCFHLVECH